MSRLCAPHPSTLTPGRSSACRHTYVGVVVIYFHHDVGRGVRHVLGVPEDLDLIEDECLVPGGVQGVLHHHCLLALVEEGDNGIRICRDDRHEMEGELELPIQDGEGNSWSFKSQWVMWGRLNRLKELQVVQKRQ